MVTQFYPPVAGGQEQHVRNLAQALVERGHCVEVVTIAVDGVVERLSTGRSVHRVRTTAQHVPRLYSDWCGRTRCRSWTLGFGARSATACCGPVRHPACSRLEHRLRHRPSPPLRSAGGADQHDYSHICATKRLMRGGDVCPGPTPIACLRCSSSWHGSVVGPGLRAGERPRPPHPHQTGGHVRPSQLGRSGQHGATRTKSPCGHPQTSFPMTSSFTRPRPMPMGRSCSSEI